MLTGRLALEARFLELDRRLERWQWIWRAQPFAARGNPWPELRELDTWLARLTPERIEVLEHSPRTLAGALTPFIPDAEPLFQLSLLERFSEQRSCAGLDDTLGYQVPGRKWEQIQAFARTLERIDDPLMEWCAGKGHLGRLLHVCSGVPVLSLDYQPALCAEGARLAARHAVRQRFVCADAMAPAASALLQAPQHALALHACGRLHLQLLQAGVQRSLRAFSISPCCYHLIEESQYQPLSQPGLASRLRLGRHELQLPLQETVTAGRRVRLQRQREVSWRLGFDLLQRQVRGEDQYLQVPSVRKSLLSTSFAEFCHWAAEKKQLSLPAGLDYQAFEAAGVERYDRVQRYELVRHLFRRPLELWLVLDRALYLAERGYRVSLGEFCDYRVTPRNLLIQARRAEGDRSG